MNTLNHENLPLQEVATNLSVIYILAQIIDDEINEVEQKLRKYGAYKMQMKQQTQALKSASREMRNKYYNQLTEQEMNDFLSDVDMIEQGIADLIKSIKNNTK